MKQHSKLSSEQQQQHAAEQHAQPAGQEFASADELLRHDAAHTAVPAAIAERLQKSTVVLPRPKAVWWKRLFGGTGP
jgi:hypothetical protein